MARDTNASPGQCRHVISSWQADPAGHPVSIASQIKALRGKFYHQQCIAAIGWISNEDILFISSYFVKNIKFAIFTCSNMLE